MDAKNFIEDATKVMHADVTKPLEIERKRQSYRTSLRGIITKICPETAKLFSNATKDPLIMHIALKRIISLPSFQDQTINVLTQIFTQLKLGRNEWSFIANRRTGNDETSQFDMEFGIKGIKFINSAGKVSDINLIIGINRGERYCDVGERFIVLGGNFDLKTTIPPQLKELGEEATNYILGDSRAFEIL